MFVDKAKIKAKGGDGGNGCCSFRREKYVPKGGPDGGDGGAGGDVIFVTDPGEQSLVDLVYNRHFQGKRGEHGKGKDQHGRRGGDVRVRIPPGTLIKELSPSGDPKITDLDRPGMEFVVARGGKGGRGNARFVSSVHRVPRECEPGAPGEEKELELELKTIADVGLVGYPNAGKSTLLRALSNARPKVAPYPFTTLNPVVGVMEFPDFARVTVADIPGLIDGAHLNVGLGHEFLRHIERTRLLAYVLDMAGVDGRDPVSDYLHLLDELELYMKGLSKRPALIIANKMDLPESAANLKILRDAIDHVDVIPLSAAKDDDFENIRRKLRNSLD